MAVSGDALLCDFESAGAYVHKSFSPVTEIYAEADFLIEQDVFDVAAALSPGDGYLGPLLSLGSFGNNAEVWAYYDAGNWRLYIKWGIFDLIIGVGDIPGTCFTLGVHWTTAPDGIFEVQIDGSTIHSATNTVLDTCPLVELGSPYSSGGGAVPDFSPCRVYIDNPRAGTTGWGSSDLFGPIDHESGTVGSLYDDQSGSVSLAAAPDCVEGDPGGLPEPGSGVGGRRFGRTPRWRFVVGNLNGAIITFLDRLATDRRLEFELNTPARAEGRVPSDEPEVNIPYQLLTNPPFLHHNSRLLWCFRREGGTTRPWVCRFGGIIMQLEDEGADAPVSHFTAFDPWQYLYSRPLLSNLGTPLGPLGLEYRTTPGSEIAANILATSILVHGDVPIDVVTGTIEETIAVPIKFERGMSVGEAWKMLCDTGTMDIVLTPVYDPESMPGKVCTLNIYEQAGTTRNNAVFAWDKPGRSLTNLSRLIDGTQLVNTFQGYAGQGGRPVDVQVDADSIDRYGEYWAQQFFVGKDGYSIAVEALALAQLRQRVNGQRTVSFSAAPERSPIPFQEYYLGDFVPVWGSRRMRDPMFPDLDDPPLNYQRIVGIPVNITDDGVEEVRDVLVQTDNGNVGT